MADGVDLEGQGSPELKETENNVAFTLKFDREALEAERANIAPEGHATLDAILALPDILAIPNETMLIVGPNGIGKSTLLGVIDMVGNAVINMKYGDSWEEAMDSATSTRGKTDTEKIKMGMVPNIARHVTVVNGTDNIGTTRHWRIPEESGKLWANLANDDLGYTYSTHVIDKQGMATEVVGFEKGTLARDTGVVGSTQQIIDQKVFGYMEEDIAREQGPFTELLDEPTSNADLQRSLRLIDDLEKMSERQGNRARFIIATNEGLFALNRNILRIDMEHPERGVHYGRDYPLDENTLQSLADMDFAPIQKD